MRVTIAEQKLREIRDQVQAHLARVPTARSELDRLALEATIKAQLERENAVIVAHYYSSNRDDPFWQAARQESVLSDTLRHRLALWRHNLPSVLDTRDSVLFNYWNYLLCLWPKGYFEGGHYPIEEMVTAEPWQAYCQHLMGQRQKLLTLLPDHVELLNFIRAGGPAGQAAPIAGLTASG